MIHLKNKGYKPLLCRKNRKLPTKGWPDTFSTIWDFLFAYGLFTERAVFYWKLRYSKLYDAKKKKTLFLLHLSKTRLTPYVNYDALGQRIFIFRGLQDTSHTGSTGEREQ